MNRNTPLAMGSVQREARAKGADVWVYRHRDGKHHRNVLLGRTDVMTVEGAHKKAHRLRSQVFENRTRTTVSVLIDRYLKEALPERMSTGAAYRSRLKRVRAAFGHVMVDDFFFDVAGVEAWLKNLVTIESKNKPPEPASKRTKNHFKAMLYLLGECAMKWNMVEIQRNPMGLVVVKTGARRKRHFTILSLEQYQALIVRPELGAHGKVMAQLAMGLGLRASEILGLRWEDVDFLDGFLRIERSVVGKHQDETKTEESASVLPLHRDLIAVLMAWHSHAPVINGWLFGSPVTGRPYHRDALHKDYLIPAAKKIGLPKLGWHDFRHSYRAMLRDLGLPLEVQQKLMRHTSIEMTAKYGGSSMDEAKRAGNTLLVEHISRNEKAAHD